MTRTLAAASVAAVLCALAGSDLSACGDKSLSAGGIRMQRALAARYPAAVLIYSPSASRLPAATHELHFQETLRKVGHKYQEVANQADLRAALRAGQFNIVLADIADVPAVQQELDAAGARLAVVAVAYKLTAAQRTQAATLSRFLIKAPSHAVEYLRTITDAVRSKGSIPRKV